MSFKSLTTMSALAAMLICSACADKPTTMTHITPTSQITSLQWDEAVAARTAAHVTNNNLIMMR